MAHIPCPHGHGLRKEVSAPRPEGLQELRAGIPSIPGAPPLRAANLAMAMALVRPRSHAEGAPSVQSQRPDVRDHTRRKASWAERPSSP